nr:hypothetical protein [Tanacetum cinerariifolium]
MVDTNRVEDDGVVREVAAGNTNEPNHVKPATKVGNDRLGITSLDKEGEVSVKNRVPVVLDLMYTHSYHRDYINVMVMIRNVYAKLVLLAALTIGSKTSPIKGLDVKEIKLVINYDAPNHYKDYCWHVIWAEVGEGQLTGPELVQETTKKIS